MMDLLLPLLLLAGILFAATTVYRRRTRPKDLLAVGVAEALMEDARQAAPAASDASIVAALLDAPNLLARATRAFAARHPDLPPFSGSPKLETDVRHQLQLMTAPPAQRGTLSAPGTPAPSRAGLTVGIVLLVIGLPSLLGCAGWMVFFLVPMMEAGGFSAQGSSAADANLNLFLALFGAPGVAFGMVASVVGYRLVRRYRRAAVASDRSLD